MTALHLLPSNASVAEEALAQAFDADLDVPYAEILDPYQSPVAWLPFLAAHHSVDLWFDDWSEDRKREMIAQSSGQSTTYPGEQLAELKGTLEGLKRYLAFVDATIIDRIAYPAHFVIGASPVGITPIAHPAYKARYLIRVTLTRPVAAHVVGRSPVGTTATFSPDLEPIRRAKRAARTAKFDHTEYVVSFARRRELTFADAPALDGSYTLGAFVDRTRL